MTPDTPSTVERSAENETLTETIVIAVSDATGVDPLDLDPLYDSVDPDALDRAFEAAEAGEAATTDRLTFAYAGGEVTVRAARSVVAAPTSAASPTPESVTSLE